jgi:hypothetical protein
VAGAGLQHGRRRGRWIEAQVSRLGVPAAAAACCRPGAKPLPPGPPGHPPMRRRAPAACWAAGCGSLPAGTAPRPGARGGTGRGLAPRCHRRRAPQLRTHAHAQRWCGRRAASHRGCPTAVAARLLASLHGGTPAPKARPPPQMKLWKPLQVISVAKFKKASPFLGPIPAGRADGAAAAARWRAPRQSSRRRRGPGSGAQSARRRGRRQARGRAARGCAAAARGAGLPGVLARQHLRVREMIGGVGPRTQKEKQGRLNPHPPHPHRRREGRMYAWRAEMAWRRAWRWCAAVDGWTRPGRGVLMSRAELTWKAPKRRLRP